MSRAVINLQQLLYSLPPEFRLEILHGDLSGTVNSVTCDSRQVGENSLFVAVQGAEADGHDYILQAVDAGCCCVVVEDHGRIAGLTDHGALNNIPVVRVRDSHAALGRLAAALHRFPARTMTMIGLTGTNGKTTVSWLVEQMLRKQGLRVGVIGTVNYRYPDQQEREIICPAPLTTPDPVMLQRLLRTMADVGVTHVVMETSSHALSLGRLEGVLFDIGLFTNLSRDHLDFHADMAGYFAAKKRLFSHYLKGDGKAVIVESRAGSLDNWSERLDKELAKEFPDIPRIRCGFARNLEVRAGQLNMEINGFSCNLSLYGEKIGYSSSLTGGYNVLNTLAAAAIGCCLGIKTHEITAGLEQPAQVPGRLERVQLAGGAEQPVVFVDYAHTPDALENVLQTLKPLTKGRLICVFGCGGDRDRGKRFLMGKTAGQLADLALITSDNPRSEDPQAIIREIARGCGSENCPERSEADLFTEQNQPIFCTIPDRRQAIHTGCSLARPGDIVLIAGKGHENYQILVNKRIFFDDRLEAKNGLLCWNTLHLLRATRGTICSGWQQGLPGEVSTDTRTIKANDIFVALIGENFDGHDYLQTAVSAGAGVLIVCDLPEKKELQLSGHALLIQVDDTLQTLGDLAAYRRSLLQPGLQVAAVTGSSGKTTVKEMTASIFSSHLQAVKTGIDPLLKTRGNFNNLVGLPLSLLPLAAGHRLAIMEMGMNHFGEIERLTEIADPDIGCVTNIQDAHLEGLGSIEGVTRAKGELFAGMRSDTVAVINCDDKRVRSLTVNSTKKIGFAVTAAGRRHKPVVRATRIADCAEQGMRFTLHINDWQQRITVAATGVHNVSNCTAAAAIAHAAGIAPETIVQGLLRYQSVDKRMQFTTLPGGINVVNDCYNANPASMAAALDTMSNFGENCRRVALLGDMLELGQTAEQAHLELGRLAAVLGYDHLAACGGFAPLVGKGARGAGMAADQIEVFADTSAAADWLYREMVQAGLKQGDWLLLKGSRGMRMEEILAEIEHRFATGIEGGRVQ
jgi:murE/murF fusion protein